MQRWRMAGNGVAALAIFVMLGCQDTTEVDASALVGSYTATTFTTVTGSTSTDQLAAGAALTITLKLDGTTSGTLFLPASGTGTTGRTESMDGTWSLAETTVTFQQAADTFMRNMPFVVGDTTLTGDQIFGDTRVVVVLKRGVAGPT